MGYTWSGNENREHYKPVASFNIEGAGKRTKEAFVRIGQTVLDSLKNTFPYDPMPEDQWSTRFPVNEQPRQMVANDLTEQENHEE